MRRDLWAATRVLVLPTLVLLFTVAIVPGRLSLVIRIYALVVCAVALVPALLALRRAYPPAPALRRSSTTDSPRRKPPPTLARMEDELALGATSAFDLHYRLRPRLRSITAGLLAARRRSTLDADPDEARQVLGDETWELVRPDRPPQARGIPPEALERVVGSLEAI
jgi:hypothetical protein